MLSVGAFADRRFPNSQSNAGLRMWFSQKSAKRPAKIQGWDNTRRIEPKSSGLKREAKRPAETTTLSPKQGLTLDVFFY